MSKPTIKMPKHNQVQFEDLEIGSTFVVGVSLFMKYAENSYLNAIRLQDGIREGIDKGTKVVPVKLNIEVTYE